MRWPWLKSPPTCAQATTVVRPLMCDECITEPTRIRQLIQEVTRQRPSLTLIGRGKQPVLAHICTNVMAHDRVHVQSCEPGACFQDLVTVLTRLDGVSLAFSGRMHATAESTWALDLPDELLYLNLRAYFRATCTKGETITFTLATGQAITGCVTNLSEEGAGVSVSTLAARHLQAQPLGLKGRLELNALSMSLGEVSVRHTTALADAVQLGLSFQLPEGTERQRLRQLLNRRQVDDARKKQNYSTFADGRSLLSSL